MKVFQNQSFNLKVIGTCNAQCKTTKIAYSDMKINL